MSSHLGEVRSVLYARKGSTCKVVIEIDEKVAYRTDKLKADRILKRPPRIYVDLSGAKVAKGVRKTIDVDDGIVRKVRVAQHSHQTVRVVVELVSALQFNVVSLEDPDRVVITVEGKGKAERADGGTPSRKSTGWTVVIDPGHGGKDPGAVGYRGLEEKGVVLRLARMVANRLQKHGRVMPILTRNEDVFIPLEERVAIANKRMADLFISIHTNASLKKDARGVATFYLDNTTDRAANRLAAMENASSKRSPNELEIILKDLRVNMHAERSVALAGQIQEALVSRLRRKYRDVEDGGVKGALFMVLLGAEMPSVLAEVSFITNSTEGKRLRQKRYLSTIADGLARGILSHLEKEERDEAR